MRYKGMLRIMACLIVVVSLLIVSYGVTFAKSDFKLSLATKMGPQSPEYQAFQRFTEIVKEKSNGKINIDMFGSEVLGTDETVFKSMSMGAVDIIAGSPVLGARTVIPKIDYITPPFVYTDFAHFQRFLKSDYMQAMFKELSEKANIILLNTEWTWRRGPFRVLLTKKPVNSLADLDGLKLRFYPSELELAVWGHLGTNPTVIAWSETYLALQQGIVESVTSPITLINDTKFVEVCPYITKTDEYPQTLVFYMNQDKFKELPEEFQQILVSACNEAGREFTSKLDSIAENVIAEAKTKYKAQYSEPDMAEFRARASEYYQSQKGSKSVNPEFLEVLDAIEKAR